jgi:tRNA threonylcarbamoyladenosine biosynthesis protein TsaE
VAAHAPSTSQQRIDLPAPADTDRLGRALAEACREHAGALRACGLQVNLSGDLGSGKTALVRAWLRALGVTGPVRSPSFTVLEPYVVSLHQSPAAGRPGVEAQSVSSLDFYHFDFYRFADPREFSIGFRDLFGAGSICAIEWPEKAVGELPDPDLAIRLTVEGDGRRGELTASSELGRACLESAARHYGSNAAA